MPSSSESGLTEIQRAVKVARRNRQDVEYAYMHLLIDVAEAAHAYRDEVRANGLLVQVKAEILDRALAALNGEVAA